MQVIIQPEPVAVISAPDADEFVTRRANGLEAQRLGRGQILRAIDAALPARAEPFHRVLVAALAASARGPLLDRVDTPDRVRATAWLLLAQVEVDSGFPAGAPVHGVLADVVDRDQAVTDEAADSFVAECAQALDATRPGTGRALTALDEAVVHAARPHERILLAAQCAALPAHVLAAIAAGKPGRATAAAALVHGCRPMSDPAALARWGEQLVDALRADERPPREHPGAMA